MSKEPTIPWLTYQYLETLIQSEDYRYFPEAGVTICCLDLKIGYSVVAEAVCANRNNFDEIKGRHHARRKALRRLMELEHYLLRWRLHQLERPEEVLEHD